MDKLLTVHEAAQKLDVSIDTIRRWEKKGLIKYVNHSMQFDSIKNMELELTSIKNS